MYIALTLRDEWAQFRGTPLVVEPRWPAIVVSGAIVLLTHGLLIETWRRVLHAWGPGNALAFWDAARIWCVTNLGKYVPGKVWGIGAMGVMAQARGVSGSAAAGSAVLGTVVNIAMGFVVALAAGWRAFDAIVRGHAAIGIVLAVAILGVLFAVPFILPRQLTLPGTRLFSRRVDLQVFPHRAVYVAMAGNLLAWILYGIAFWVFVYGTLGVAGGTLSDYVAAYASSYVVGYLALVVPAGLGVREGALTVALTTLGLATLPQAAVVAVTSRLWVTVLEVGPGLAFLARHQSMQPPRTQRVAEENSQLK